MVHKHLKEVNSTQTYLLENIDEYKNDQDILISCDSQLSGHGQYERVWDSFEDSICMSFTITPNPIMTLTPLEIGCLIHKYFITQEKIDLSLKWPNDLLTKKAEKVGGIIINNTNRDKLIVGIGLNLFLPSSFTKEYKTKAGSIFNSQKSIDKSSYSKQIYYYILANRMNEFEVKNYWNAQCIHLNKEILFIEDGHQKSATFIELGPNGEAVIKSNGILKKHYSGSILLTT